MHTERYRQNIFSSICCNFIAIAILYSELRLKYAYIWLIHCRHLMMIKILIPEEKCLQSVCFSIIRLTRNLLTRTRVFHFHLHSILSHFISISSVLLPSYIVPSRCPLPPNCIEEPYTYYSTSGLVPEKAAPDCTYFYLFIVIRCFNFRIDWLFLV